jgi:choline kinase
MSIVEHAVIAAAGLGSRLGHGKPKCLVKIDGVSVLAHLLTLVEHVPDVRVVVGFMEADVIEELARLRPDAVAVRNPSFRITTTLHSYALGARHLQGDCLFMDADLLVVPQTFRAFLESCRPGEPRLALTPNKTQHPVYTELDGERVVGFRREQPTEFEWSNISWLPVGLFANFGHSAVYEHLRQFLPFASGIVDAYEIDTEEDLRLAKANAAMFELDKCIGAAKLRP